MLKSLFHVEKCEHICPQYMDEVLRPLLSKPNVYTESVNLMQLLSTPGIKIKQHTVYDELPSVAILIDENVNGINLAEGMANAETQLSNENQETNSVNEEGNNNSAM